MDATERDADLSLVRDPQALSRRRIVRAGSGGLVAVFAAAVLAACGGDATEDEAEGDE
jgi:hypothetical protein